MWFGEAVAAAARTSLLSGFGPLCIVFLAAGQECFAIVAFQEVSQFAIQFTSGSSISSRSMI